MTNKSPDAFRTISEVAEWLGVPTHVLRFWESRFSQVKPVKRAGGRRYYRPADMELLGGIRKLLHEDGMTIRGVQKLLRENGVKHVAAFSPDITNMDQGEPAQTNVVTLDLAGSGETDAPEIEDAEIAGEPDVVVATTADAEPAAPSAPQEISAQVTEPEPGPPAAEASEPDLLKDTEAQAPEVPDTPEEIPSEPEEVPAAPDEIQPLPVEAPPITPEEMPQEIPVETPPAEQPEPAPQAEHGQVVQPVQDVSSDSLSETAPVDSTWGEPVSPQPDLADPVAAEPAEAETTAPQHVEPETAEQVATEVTPIEPEPMAEAPGAPAPATALDISHIPEDPSEDEGDVTSTNTSILTSLRAARDRGQGPAQNTEEITDLTARLSALKKRMTRERHQA